MLRVATGFDTALNVFYVRNPYQMSTTKSYGYDNSMSRNISKFEDSKSLAVDLQTGVLSKKKRFERFTNQVLYHTELCWPTTYKSLGVLVTGFVTGQKARISCPRLRVLQRTVSGLELIHHDKHFPATPPFLHR